MPAVVKKRKVSAAKSASTIVKPMNAFTQVSKASSITKNIIDKHHCVDFISTVSYEDDINEKKRKLDDEEEGAVDSFPAVFAATINNRRIKLSSAQRRSVQVPQTPQQLIATTNSPPSTGTPTKGARIFPDRLHMPCKTPCPSSIRSTSTTPKTASTELPTELLDLINLHAAFLTALSLHYAHNGTHSPADLRLLCPDVARAWGKRKVSFEDIRRTLGIMNTGIGRGEKDARDSRLSLSDYGQGKICIEIKTGVGKAGRLARPVNENLLNEIFARALRTFWEERNGMDTEAYEIVNNLPLEPITTCSSLAKISPLLVKGQRRLEDMRAGIILKKEAIERKKVGLVDRPDATKPTLLERLRAKQLEHANKAPPPTKAEIGRRAALQRLDEVVSVLSILSTSSSVGQSRISFTMPTVLGKLRDSFKTPISKEEGDACVRLLASDIAPEWVKIVKMGKIEALAVNRDERPTDLELEQRIKSTV